jgi:glycosyltransferase involved in cell wall biosynthesis
MLSVIVITKNEAKRIAQCLASVNWADELLVLDSGSSDDTVAIAKSFDAKVIETDWPGFGPQKQRALSLCSHEWVLSIDADEFLEKDAATLILKAIQTNKIDAYMLPRQMIFAGRILRFAAYEKKHIRLFRRNLAHFSPHLVHEHVELKQGARKATLATPIMHDCYDDWDDAIEKMNRYSSLSALQRFQQGRQSSIVKALISSNLMFLKNYFLRLWCLDGWPGLCLAVYQAQGAWYRHLKQVFMQAGK